LLSGLNTVLFFLFTQTEKKHNFYGYDRKARANPDITQGQIFTQYHSQFKTGD